MEEIMFDFLLSEEFWMDTLTASLIAAAAAITASIIAGIFSNRKISKDIAIHEEKSNSRNQHVSQENAHLAKEHSSLSDEHKELANSIRAIRECQVEEKAKHEMHYTSMSDAQQRLASSAADMGKFAQEFSRLASENQQLKQQVQQLTQENQILRQQRSPQSPRQTPNFNSRNNEPEL
jgi:chromosome segregation ATPase